MSDPAATTAWPDSFEARLEKITEWAKDICISQQGHGTQVIAFDQTDEAISITAQLYGPHDTDKFAFDMRRCFRQAQIIEYFFISMANWLSKKKEENLEAIARTKQIWRHPERELVLIIFGARSRPGEKKKSLTMFRLVRDENQTIVDLTPLREDIEGLTGQFTDLLEPDPLEAVYVRPQNRKDN